MRFDGEGGGVALLDARRFSFAVLPDLEILFKKSLYFYRPRYC